MPFSEKTPVAPRRFLPPSSTGTNPSILSSNHKHPFQTSRSTPSVSASPFGGTPRFQRGAYQEKDDIQTHFEDELGTPSFPNARTTMRPRDAIEPEDDELERTSPLQHRKRMFAPVTKRRKTSHSRTQQGETVTISSSPDSDELNDNHAYDELGSPVSGSKGEVDVDVALKTPGTNQSDKVTRFRPTAPGLPDATPLSKNVFKSASKDTHQTPSASGPAIPDVFSPSRRKGKGDYIAGGSADIVRSWVLDIAAQESQAASISELSIIVKRITKDTSSRFAIVVDESGAQWLLPEQHQKSLAGLKTTWADLRPGSLILIKGQAMKWPLQLGSALDDVCVAASWGLLSPR